jgi:hypothetical protein
MTAAAHLTQEEWDHYRGQVVRVAGEQSQLAMAVRTLTDQCTRLTAAVDRLERGIRKTDRRLDSWEDLSDQRDRAELMAEVDKLRKRPRAIAKWLGWGIGIAAAAVEIAARVGWIK